MRSRAGNSRLRRKARLRLTAWTRTFPAGGADFHDPGPRAVSAKDDGVVVGPQGQSHRKESEIHLQELPLLSHFLKITDTIHDIFSCSVICTFSEL